MNIRSDLNMSPGSHYTKLLSSNTVHIIPVKSKPETILKVPDDNFKSKLKTFLFEKLYNNWKELLI